VRVVEVSYTWPAETFIQRHVLALREAGANVVRVTRAGVDVQHASGTEHNSREYSE
jgi:hypothetical protein